MWDDRCDEAHLQSEFYYTYVLKGKAHTLNPTVKRKANTAQLNRLDVAAMVLIVLVWLIQRIPAKEQQLLSKQRRVQRRKSDFGETGLYGDSCGRWVEPDFILVVITIFGYMIIIFLKYDSFRHLLDKLCFQCESALENYYSTVLNILTDLTQYFHFINK